MTRFRLRTLLIAGAAALSVALGGCVAYPGYGYGYYPGYAYNYAYAPPPVVGFSIGGWGGWHDHGWHDHGWGWQH